MQYAFEMTLATEYGVNEAIFVHRLYWWVRDNAANERNYRDGHYWTYDSLKALTEIFPCWSRRQLEGIISKCREKGLILTSSYSQDKRDRTTWYTVTDAVIQAYEPIPTAPPKRGNAFHEMGKCIPPDGDAHFTDRGNVYNEHLEDHLEDEREGARASEETPPDEPVEHYGEMLNVRLTPTELDRLLHRWPAQQVQAEIDNLSLYMHSRKKQYKNHYATLIIWLKRDYPEGVQQGRVLIDDD